MNKLPDIVPIITHVRLAARHDVLQAPGILKFGQPFYLYSHRTRKFEGIYVMNAHHSTTDIQAWFNASMIYVPINVLENPIVQVDKPELEKQSA